jgi:hypothetical protein
MINLLPAGPHISNGFATFQTSVVHNSKTPTSQCCGAGGAEIKLPGGAIIMNYGTGSGSLLLYRRLQ